MGKVASHFIWCADQIYRLHYMEWDQNGRLSGIFPLLEEIAGVAFFNGTLVPILSTDLPKKDMSEKDWQGLAAKVEIGSSIKIYHIDGSSFREIPMHIG